MRPVCKAALDLIAVSEGEVDHTYQDVGGVETIGIGHTGPDVYPGQVITHEQALALLARDVEKFARGIERLLGGAPTTDNQFGAMVSFAFNVGLGNFGRSSVLRLHLARDYTGAAMSFRLWDKADGRVFPALLRRRIAEAKLYLTAGEEVIHESPKPTGSAPASSHALTDDAGAEALNRAELERLTREAVG